MRRRDAFAYDICQRHLSGSFVAAFVEEWPAFDIGCDKGFDEDPELARFWTSSISLDAVTAPPVPAPGEEEDRLHRAEARAGLGYSAKTRVIGFLVQ